MKLIITGGHLTPALTLIEYIEKKQAGWNIVFVGRKNAVIGNPTVSEEFRIIHEKNIPFIELSAGRVRRFLSVGTFLSLCMIPVGFIQAIGIVLKQKPTCIVSFGGYIGLPIVFAGWLFGIPAVIHEQAAVPGLSNKIASVFARYICVSNDAGLAHFPKNKTIVTGLPLRQIIFNPPKQPSLSIPQTRKILYITGGATGSQSINELFYPVIGKLVGKYTIVHQVGRAWVSKAKKIRQAIRGDKRKYYIVQAYVDQHDHSWLMHNASLLVGRSGANTVAEIDVAGIPALLIPLPWSASNEQYENAQVLVRKQKAVCIEQSALNSTTLLQKIFTLLHDSKPMKRFMENMENRQDAASEKLFSVIVKFSS